MAKELDYASKLIVVKIIEKMKITLMGVLMSRWLKCWTMPQSKLSSSLCKNENNPNGSPHVPMAKVLDYSLKIIVIKIMQKWK